MNKVILGKILKSLFVFNICFGIVVSGMSSYNMISVQAATIKLNSTSKTLIKGKTYQLKVSGTKKKITWSTSKKSIATVSSKGKVTAKGVGTAYIYAKVSGKKLKCKIKVESPSLSSTKLALLIGEQKTLSVKGNTQKVSWSTNNKSIATVSSKGVVTAKSVGLATISAKVSGKTMKCNINVESPAIAKEEALLAVGESYTLKVNGTTQKITWQSSDNNVVSVSSNGVLSAKSTGEAIITAQIKSKIMQCLVVVKAYEISNDENGMYCHFNDEFVRNVYMAFNEKTNQFVSTNVKGSKIYYFNEDGIGTLYTDSKVIKITFGNGSKQYYVSKGTFGNGWDSAHKKYYSNGVALKNQIVGTKNNYYYVDKSGVCVNTKEIKEAVNFVQSHSTLSKSKSDRLKQCYNYLSNKKYYTYKRYYNENPKAKDMPKFAYDMFTQKKGNCYRYAASFAYIARVLGYDSRVAVGKISAARGGMTPHGWTEVKKSDGKWYICDPDMQMSKPKINSYMKTDKKYAYKHTCSKRFTLSASSGKVTWK